MIKLFPIRHHGVGSSKALCVALETFKPDCVLIEGPPEGNDLVEYVVHEEMKPPVALLAYAVDKPESAVFYPFALYSPEWQALCYGVKQGIPTRFFDLPLAYQFEDEWRDESQASEQSALSDDVHSPLDDLAHVAGFDDGVTWWDTVIEERGEDCFEAIVEAISALREHYPTSKRDAKREAYMRLQIRAAEKEGFERIAVVCGAWHSPALLAKVSKKEDEAHFKGMSKAKVSCTWINWTNSRLSQQSGYGAGIDAPHYYEYQWQYPDDNGLLWVLEMAQLLRAKRFEVSAAHVMEIWRLSSMMAKLRGLAKPHLEDYLESLKSVVSMGDESALAVIREDLLVGNSMGHVPDSVPKLPLLWDLEQAHKRLRLPLTAEVKTLKLDLRKPLDLERSIFLHRLHLLGINWGHQTQVGGRGTFAEAWELHYQPEYHIQAAEKAIYGTTLAESCQHYLQEQMSQASLAKLSALLPQVLPADLPQVLASLSQRIMEQSASTQDILQMLSSLPALCEGLRYGSVRDGIDGLKSEGKVADGGLWQVLETLVIRIEVGMVLGCSQIDDDSAKALFQALRQAHYALVQLADEGLLSRFHHGLLTLIEHQTVHPMLSGLAARIGFEQSALSEEEMEFRFSQSLSASRAANDVALWLEGFLFESGTMLLLYEALWSLVFRWVEGLDDERFMEILPLLRRTFSSFEFGERRQIGEKVKQPIKPLAMPSHAAFTPSPTGQSALMTMADLLGLQAEAL